MKIFSSITLYFLIAASTNAFVIPVIKPFAVKQECLKAKTSDDSEVTKTQAFSVGTLVEFSEKNRVHVGKITSVEHKANGGARYSVADDNGKIFHISDKSVNFGLPAPNTPGAAERLFRDFTEAHLISELELREKLDVTPDLIEMVWEECAEDSTDMTPKRFIELLHAHSASAIETYMAWRLLKADIAHVFFKDMKQHGRVVAFKAKARKAVDAARQAFCSNPDHLDEADFCFV